MSSEIILNWFLNIREEVHRETHLYVWHKMYVLIFFKYNARNGDI